MITKEELNRVNEINKEIHDAESLANSSITNYNFHNKFSIELKCRLNDTAKTVCREYIKELMSEYNNIISPSEPNSLSQS